MAAPTVSLSYTSTNKTFTATVTTDPGWRVLTVSLMAPGGANYPMTPSANPSQWTYLWTMPTVPSGTYTATAQCQAPPAPASGSTSVP